MRDEWQEVEIGRLVETALAPFEAAESPQISRSGPSLTLNSRAALALAMALHEMCTNAVKYGALQDAEGRVELTWSVEREAGDGEATFRLVWRESNGAAGHRADVHRLRHPHDRARAGRPDRRRGVAGLPPRRPALRRHGAAVHGRLDPAPAVSPDPRRAGALRIC